MKGEIQSSEQATSTALRSELRDYSDIDLREMLSSLSSTMESCVTQIATIERELHRRESILLEKSKKKKNQDELAPADSLEPVEIALVSTIEVRKDETEGCILCGLCSEVCPWQAPIIINKKLTVRQERCRGCGVCVAACPSRAIDMKVYETGDLLDLIHYVLKEDVLIEHPDSVHQAVLEAQTSLMNIERILSHRARDKPVEDMLHTLRRMVDRIDKMGDQLRGVQKEGQVASS
ncbi:MAG: ATP-binding protein [Candidatus Thorarchaeota archaeon]